MNSRATGFPSFGRPPVVEVALAISFDPVQRMTTADLGALWEREYRPRGFAFTEDQPPVRVIPEDFGSAIAGLPSIQVQVTSSRPVPRMLFIKERGDELVQCQLDWFARNWRKAEPDMPYPRYSAIRIGFRDDFEHLVEFVRAEELGTVQPRTWEVTYVNHIPAGDGWDGLEHPEQVLSPLAQTWRPSFLDVAEFTRFAQQFVIPGRDGNPVGRLHVTAEPAFREGKSPMLLLTMTARGNIADPESDVLDHLDIGHEFVVKGFKDVTTERIHDTWEIDDA